MTAIGDRKEAPRLEWARSIEAVCRCFEEACLGKPRIEDFLDGWPEPARAALLKDLVRIEVLHRRRRGEQSRIEDYRDRFPELEAPWLAYVIASATTRPDTPAELRNGQLKAAAAWVGTLPPLQDCQILERLGRGGMSDVFRARQGLLNREVAVKMIRTHAGPEEIALFQAEAEAVAKLKHPNIVQIHEIGERNGRPCLVLELVEGGSLARLLNGKPVPGRVAAELIKALALVIHYTHQQGIIHCDLKPGNILLQFSRKGGKLAGQSTIADLPLAIPKIADFGIARHLGGSVEAVDAKGAGTPNYMAPEQVAGRSDLIGPPTDVYALGAILYELLTGSSPFNEETPEETRRQVMTRAPLPPSLLQSRVPPDLETICLTCLEKNPNDRYASAEELAQDLDNYLRGEPILKQPPSWLQRLGRIFQRSVHLAELQRWGQASLWDGGAMLLGHGILFRLIQTDQPVGLLWSVMLGYTLFSVWLFWYLLIQHSGRLTDHERDLRHLWIGCAFASLALGALYCPPWGQERAADLLNVYPPLLVIVGVILFAGGRMLPDRLYLLGLAAFLLALLLRFCLEWSPLVFGIFYASTVLTMGYQARRAAQESLATKLR